MRAPASIGRRAEDRDVSRFGSVSRHVRKKSHYTGNSSDMGCTSEQMRQHIAHVLQRTGGIGAEPGHAIHVSRMSRGRHIRQSPSQAWRLLPGRPVRRRQRHAGSVRSITPSALNDGSERSFRLHWCSSPSNAGSTFGKRQELPLQRLRNWARSVAASFTSGAERRLPIRVDREPHAACTTNS
jgi:hypothetical protein